MLTKYLALNSDSFLTLIKKVLKALKILIQGISEILIQGIFWNFEQ